MGNPLDKKPWFTAGGSDLTGYLKGDGTIPLTANWDVGSFTITALRFISDQTTGTSPFVVTSTTVVTNLNADLLDGSHASAFEPALGNPGGEGYLLASTVAGVRSWYNAAGAFAAIAHNHAGVYEPLFTVATWAGTTNITTLGTIGTGSWHATTIAVDHGGTGLTTYAVGDILYASVATTLAGLTAVATGQVLVSAGANTAPAWSATPSITSLTALPTLGNELITFSDTFGSGTNWAWSTNKWAHTATSAVALTSTWTPTAGTQYKIVIAITDAGTGDLSFAFGGNNPYTMNSSTTYTFYLTAHNTTAITFTPTNSSWTGSVDSVSVKVITLGNITAESLTLQSGRLLVHESKDSSTSYPQIAVSTDTDTGINLNSTPGIEFVIGANKKLAISNSAIETTVYISLMQSVYLRGDNANELQLGYDSATPSDQIFKSCDGLGANIVGSLLTIQGGQSTGTGLPAGIALQTPFTGAASNSTAQTEYTRYRVPGRVFVLSNNSATAIISVACADGNTVGGMIIYSLEVTDGTDFQSESGTVIFTGINKATEAWTTNIAETSTQALSAGTLATTWAIDTATADTLKVTLNSNSGTITPTSIKLRYQVFMNCPQALTIL